MNAITNCEDYTILVVDDEEDLRDVVADYLEDEGFNVLTASSGNEAFDIVKNNIVHLIISDINMPQGNGVELLNNVKKDNPEKPVLLFITGFADVTIEEAYEKGAEALFSKPIDFAKLIQVVKEHLVPKEDMWSRVEDRYDIILDVTLTFENYENAVSTKALNIGRGGMFIALESNFPEVEDVINFTINFNNGPIITLEGVGTTRWVRKCSNDKGPSGAGVEFLKLTPESKKALLELINSIKTRTYIPMGQ